MSKSKILFLLCLAFFIFLAYSQLLTNPPIWSDEVYTSDVALNLLREGRMGTDLWGNMINGASSHVYFYPPGLFILFALQIQAFGFSILNQRLLTLFVGSIFVVVYYLLVKEIFRLELGKKHKADLIIFMPIILLITNAYFLSASRISRPEIYVMLFGFLGILLLLKAEAYKFYHNMLYLLSGLSVSIACMFHFMGLSFLVPSLIYIVFKYKFNFLNKRLCLFILGAFTPILFWAVWIFPNRSYFFNQLQLQSQFRDLTLWSLWIEFLQGVLLKKIEILSYILFLILLVPFSIYSLRRKKYYFFLILGSMLLLFFYMYIGKLGWYTVLIIPFVYLSFFLYIIKVLYFDSLLNFSITKGTLLLVKYFLFFCFVLYLGLNIKLYIQSQIDLSNNNEDYSLLSESLLKIVPDNATVYLSTIPDTYYVFKEHTDNKLYRFPVLESNFTEYIKVLNKSDYILYNYNYPAMFLGNFLEKYIDINKDTVISVGEDNGYNVLVIKLKPKNQRVLPSI